MTVTRLRHTGIVVSDFLHLSRTLTDTELAPLHEEVIAAWKINLLEVTP